MTAYYNEIDPFCVQWLRNLIDAGHIAPGVVDDRSIEHVVPSDLKGFTQCHFFAGIGVWSYALRMAGWPDDRHVWTGSCPCQPFSNTGKRIGIDDERHLWPDFHWHIEQCQPSVVFGEQVSSPIGLEWLDTVQNDMEASGFAFAATDIGASWCGAPHRRQRLYFVGLANTYHAGPQRWSGKGYGDYERAVGARSLALHGNPLRSVWAEADWVYCDDEKWRPTEPGIFPLVDGIASRVERLRAYGNAIVPQVAARFIQTVML